MENQIFKATTDSQKKMVLYEDTWKLHMECIGMQKNAPMKYLLQHIAFDLIYTDEVPWTLTGK